MLNNPPGQPNSITVFARGSDGALNLQGSTPIGGIGGLAPFADGTQGSLILAPDGQRLFAVSAGSNQISVVDVHEGQLTPVSLSGSAGAGPVSLTYGGGLLYVLNAANGSDSPANVAGFSVDGSGALHPLANSIRPLSTAHPNPAQVLLDPQHRTLIVTEKSTNLIDVYQVGRDGSLTGPTIVRSVGVYPFGMAFAQVGAQSELIVNDGVGGPNGTGGVTAYSLPDGLMPLQGPLFDHQIAPCWVVVTDDGRFAYASNADSRSISGFRIRTDGSIGLLNADGITATTPGDTFPLEETLSRNSQFLYVLDSRLLLAKPGPATLSGFRIQADGQLSPVVDSASITLSFSAIGLAAD
ncbi:MAG: lactonase family protein [Actinomycetota bacterium]|nr:lactonase family protein [Actinomycetota bacterium]